MRETGAYIIVSYVHLGSKEYNYKEFCYFLEWIRDLENKPKIIKCKDKEVTVKNPFKIILLEDKIILDRKINCDDAETA
jgi:hypothetical protein